MSDERVTHTQDVTIRSVSVSEMDNNVYLLTSNRTGSQVLIDAADDAPAIERLIQDGAADAGGNDPVLRYIVTTHRHWDHVRALAATKESTKAPTAAGRDDAPAIETPTDLLLDDGDLIEVPGFTLEVIHLVGHTPGSVALVLRDAGDGPANLFTGDSLFPGGVGKTQSPQDFTSLIDDVEHKLFDRFADDTIVHPGHGAGTTIGDERASLPQWRERGW